MQNVLIINASNNTSTSVSRNLTDVFVDNLQKAGLDTNIVYRDLAKDIIPHISEEWINADRKPVLDRSENDREILLRSDNYIKELKAADTIVLASPMYNWGVPSHLKAYLDHVLRYNETFGVATDEEGTRYKGLLINKKLVLILARGSSGYGKGERNELMDSQLGYIKLIFGVMGLENISEIILDGMNETPDNRDQKINFAASQIGTFVDAQMKTTT